MTPTEAALRAALEHIRYVLSDRSLEPTLQRIAKEALAAAPHGKDAGECYSMSAGEADQRMGESKAVRKALGFDPDSIHVAPVDLSDAISALQARLAVAEGLIGRAGRYIRSRNALSDLAAILDAFLKEGGKP